MRKILLVLPPGRGHASSSSAAPLIQRGSASDEQTSVGLNETGTTAIHLTEPQDLSTIQE